MKNIIGQKFGKLEIIEFVESKQYGKNKKRIYKAKCDCGGEIIAIGDSFKSGKTTSCGCLRWAVGPKNKKWTGHGEISGNFWDSLKRNSQNRQLNFNISIENIWDLFLKQQRKCALSGLQLTFSNQRDENTASLDRINSNIGYEIDNVQWIHKDINKMKNNFDQDYFFKICKLITEAQHETKMVT